MLSDLSVDRFLADKPLALTMAGLEELRAHILARIAVFESGPRDFLTALAADMRETLAATNKQQERGRATGVGVIQIRGTISQHAQDDLSSMLFGGTSTEAVGQAIDAFLSDGDVGKIVLDIDSPGGSTYGLSELAAKIRASRSQKPIVAVANSLAASAAYWIGSSASEFYAAPGSLVGSIGVYALHMDYSGAAEKEGIVPTYISAGEFKVEGNQFEPLGDDARAHIQAIVDDSYAAFVTDVSRGRGASEATVRNGYGKGRVLTAKQAKSAGMIDGIQTLEQAIRRPIAAARAAEEPTEEEQAASALADDEARAAGIGRLAWLRLRELDARIPA